MMCADSLTQAATEVSLFDHLLSGYTQLARPSGLSLAVKVYARQRHELLLGTRPCSCLGGPCPLGDHHCGRWDGVPSNDSLSFGKYGRGHGRAFLPCEELKT